MYIYTSYCEKRNIRIPRFTLTMLLKHFEGISNGCEYMSKIPEIGMVYWTFRTNSGCVCVPAIADHITIDCFGGQLVKRISMPDISKISLSALHRVWECEFNLFEYVPIFDMWMGKLERG